ncbi:DUF3137 domain-containing protein [Marinicellulosiphila megalodicopiae]|uniref:DUF3137 domain-containing protein n=1 Tax=Marinicellulosiphila megalodicopiae TaxID=2724896 RepID=UPI003BAE17B5
MSAKFVNLLLGHGLSPFTGEVMFNNTAYTSHYDKHIRPFVQDFENERIKALIACRKRSLTSIFICAILLLYFIPFFVRVTSDPDGTGFIIGMTVFICICFGNWSHRPLKNYKSSVKQNVYPNIFSFFGEDFKYCENDTLTKDSISIDSLQPSGLIPSHNRSSTEDFVSGYYKGVKLELFEAELIRKSKDSKGRDTSSTVFKGIFIRLNMNKSFNCKTIVKRDQGKIGNWFGDKFSKLETVRLEDPIFEKMFQIYSDDQVEARYLLTTSFMQRLINLTEVFGSKNIQCSFYNNQLLFMISTSHNRFETASAFKPATFETEINTILNEMDEIFQIIDTLKLDEQTGL